MKLVTSIVVLSGQEETSRGPSKIEFRFDETTGEPNGVYAEYVESVRNIAPDGTVTLRKSTPIKEALVSWETALQIAPSLAQVRTELASALPTLLANP